jgi:hypothetical protein
MNALESLIAVLSTPVARRQGVTISSEDCAIWVEEIEKEMTHIRGELKKYYELKANTTKKLGKVNAIKKLG